MMRRKLNVVKSEPSIDYAQQVQTAWKYIHENAARYSEPDLLMLKTSIINVAKRYGVEIEPPKSC
jgi:hypothetical protein